MPRFGPFAAPLDALVAACPLILSQPRATAGRQEDMNFETRWRVSTEYCAWLYYTPAEQFEMSMLVESTEPRPPGEQNERGCRMPAFVSDSRYPPRSLKHVYVLHNHPETPTNLSEKDINALVKVARLHGEFVETKAGRIPVGVVAFFSNTYAPSEASCGGFFEYSLGAKDVLKWTPDAQGKWRSRSVGTITWVGKTKFYFEPTSGSASP
ncbi:hypothetical protein MEBOL_007873 [Melittangium boletus DSM 14713]|uniref:Uncharacterized protein n=2 Tax=Melittangium boletus TaxID=83453 RepID=A0A250IT97_9BACT|nr:hypothetical protein MEBOL_007873 [Melittangium boletus DSM 14713]